MPFDVDRTPTGKRQRIPVSGEPWRVISMRLNVLLIKLTVHTVPHRFIVLLNDYE